MEAWLANDIKVPDTGTWFGMTWQQRQRRRRRLQPESVVADVVAVHQWHDAVDDDDDCDDGDGAQRDERPAAEAAVGDEAPVVALSSGIVRSCDEAPLLLVAPSDAAVPFDGWRGFPSI